VQQWLGTYFGTTVTGEVSDVELAIATQAARWGADMELEACCEWLDRNNQWAQVDIDELRDARRPKPPTLKEQALRDLDALAKDLERNGMGFGTAMIRRALEALPND
jgi:hypothetical protein